MSLLVAYPIGKHCRAWNKHHRDTQPKITVIVKAVSNHNPKTGEHDSTKNKVDNRGKSFVPLLCLANFFKEFCNTHKANKLMIGTRKNNNDRRNHTKLHEEWLALFRVIWWIAPTQTNSLRYIKMAAGR